MPLRTPHYPGLDPDANRGPQMEAVGIAFLCLSIIIVGLRFFSRLYTRIELWVDDWLVVASAVLSWGYTATVIYEVQYNYYGQHIGKSDPAHVESWAKGLYGLAIAYPMALTLSKLSLLAIYWRIFRVTTARRPTQIAVALNIGWMLAAVLVGIFSCTPIEGFWNPSIKSRCINYNVFFLSNESFTIALDLVVLLMPVYFISNLQKSLSQRISISSTFLLGLVVTMVSAIRLWRLVVAMGMPGPDPTWIETDAALWAIVELNLWVVVASIPALRPLLSRIITKRSHSKSDKSSSARMHGSGLNSMRPQVGWPSFKNKPRSGQPCDSKDLESGREAAIPALILDKDYRAHVNVPIGQTGGWFPLGVGEAKSDNGLWSS